MACAPRSSEPLFRLEFPSETIPTRTFSACRQRRENLPPCEERQASKPERWACPCPPLPPERSNRIAFRSSPQPRAIAMRVRELPAVPILQAEHAGLRVQPRRLAPGWLRRPVRLPSHRRDLFPPTSAFPNPNGPPQKF